MLRGEVWETGSELPDHTVGESGLVGHPLGIRGRRSSAARTWRWRHRVVYGALDRNGRYILKAPRIDWPASSEHGKESEQLGLVHAAAAQNIPSVEE